MTYKITDIEGIGREYGEKLKSLGIQTTDDLLRHSADERSIRTLAEKSGVSEKLFEKWTKMSRLMRVNGIGPQYSELLFIAGVDTVEKLREQPVDGLVKKLAEVNATRNLTNALPTVTDVQKWMANARTTTHTPDPAPVRN